MMHMFVWNLVCKSLTMNIFNVNSGQQTDDNARLDISVKGFWERLARTFFKYVSLPHLLQLTSHISWKDVTTYMRWRLDDRMNVSVNMARSLHPWSLPLLEGWANKQRCLLKTPRLPACQEEGPALQQCDGME